MKNLTPLLNHYYTADVCTAETVAEQNELFKQLLKSI